MTTQGNEISRTLPLGVETTGDDNDFTERKFYDAQDGWIMKSRSRAS